MHLRRKLLKLALPMVVGYFVDPQLGADRRRRIVGKVQRMLGKAPALDDQGRNPENWTPPTVAVVSETVTERLVVADGNGRVTGETSSTTAASAAEGPIDSMNDRSAFSPSSSESSS